MTEWVLLGFLCCLFWGISSACLRKAIHATMRNDLFRCRDKLIQLALSGEINPHEKSIQELTGFIHNLIVYSEQASLFDWVVAHLRTEKKQRENTYRPAFLDDSRLSGIVSELLNIILRGFVYSSWLLAISVILAMAVSAIYSPLKGVFAKVEVVVAEDLLTNSSSNSVGHLARAT